MAPARLQLTKAQAIAKAKAEVGVRENPIGSNRVKYTDWCGVRTAWCAIFALWLPGAHTYGLPGARHWRVATEGTGMAWSTQSPAR
jgi:hypothetical protein